MSRNQFFMIRTHVGTRSWPWRRPALGAYAGACLLWLLPLCVVMSVPGNAVAQTGTLSVADNEPVDIAPGEPGPGDLMVFAVRRDVRYVVSLAFTTGQPGEVVSHRLHDDGQLELVGRTPAGREPRAIAMARNGDYAVVVNSIDDEIAVMSIGDDGLLQEVTRSASGGLNPYDVAVAHDDIVVVVNRDSNQVNTFHIDRRGRLVPLSQASTGLAPHVVAVSRRGGKVAVCNQVERSVSIFDVDRRGRLFQLGTIPTDNMIPTTASWQGRQVFVALDRAFPEEDVIRSYHVDRRGGVTQGSDTSGGVFLTDIEANEDGLFAVTANRNNPADPFDDRDEVRVYQIDGTDLWLDATVQTGSFPPSFKQVSTGPGRGSIDRHVIVSEFQSGYLRSLVYLPLITR